jgi:hypothetical protein
MVSSAALAQGAFRMRGIGEGQTVTILIIPEVKQLMRRQLKKQRSSVSTPDASPLKPTQVNSELAELPTPPAAAAMGPATEGASTQAALLLDVSAWLVINSMRAERVQFDQLCGQNLANIWRQNAWNELLEGHQHFKVRPEATHGFALDLMGDAFVSKTHGNVSREKLEGQTVGI